MYSGTHQERFDKAIYLTYVSLRLNYKNATKEVFEEKLYSILNKRRTIYFDKSRVYRLADEKEIWFSKYNHIIGEVWKETDEFGDEVVSYWIDEKLL